MRSLLLSLVVITACGANAAQLQRARTAQYHGDPAAMLQAAAQGAEAQGYKIAQLDADGGAFLTALKIFGPEGDFEGVGAGDTVTISDRSIAIEILVKLTPVEGADTFALAIEPNMQRLFVDRGNPDQLAPDDPSVPGWVHGRIDDLTIAIHDALGAYEVKSPPTP